MLFEYKEIKQESKYNQLPISKILPLTQTWFFGEWQETMGRKARRFELSENSKTIGVFQIVKYPFPFGQSFVYISHGPIIFDNYGDRDNFLKSFQEILLKILREENSIFARFDFYSSGGKNEEKLNLYFKKVPQIAYRAAYFQPKYEWILNIEKSEEELLAGMHPKTRYNIGLAERRGIKIETINDNFNKYFNDFYKLMEETAIRDNFNLHPKIYYKNIFSNCEKNKNAFLTIAKLNSRILAINLILFYNETAYFVFGGSSDEYKNLMAPYLLHWRGILEAKRQGLKIYNFGAVGLGNFEGISRFKKGFGGELLEYSDSYDLVLKPFWYYLYNLRKLLKR